MEQPVLQIKNITKKFGEKVANDNISLTVQKQTIHCVIGENGSGKTTLMNIIFGLYKPDSGSIFINGQKVRINNPKTACRFKIGMVHQHFMLFERHTVLENIILGEEKSRIILQLNQAQKSLEEMINKYHFNIDLNQKVQDLPVGIRQKIEILKVLYRGADIIIFDEPTAVLTPQEVEQLLEIILNLKKMGKTIIFISHKLNEVSRIGDYVTVLRRGRVVYESPCKDIDMDKIAYEMVGKTIKLNNLPRTPYKPGEVVLEIKDAELRKGKTPISLKVHKGEIVGIAGVDGNGQSELEQLVIGLKYYKNGEIKFCGKDISRSSVMERKKAGIVYVPSDRLKNGVMEVESYINNVLLGNHEKPEFNSHGIINDKQLRAFGKRIIEEYDVKIGDMSDAVNTLSGGNQQKVVLGRELGQNHNLILAAQPTRGLDIGAIEFVHKKLLEERDKGNAIILISTELSEIMELSDRIIVLYEGEIMSDALTTEYSSESIGMRMAGRRDASYEV